MGYSLWKSGDLTQAETFIMEGIEILKGHENTEKDIGEALRMVGNLYYTNKNYDAAREYYNLSLNKMKEIENLKGIAAALANLGMVIKDPQISRDMAFEALEIAYKIKDKFLIAIFLNAIASSYLNLGNIEKFLEYSNLSLEIREKIGDKYGMAVSFANVGSIHCNSGNLEKGMEFLRRSEELFTEIGSQRDITRLRCRIGHIHILSGDLGKAEEILLTSYELEERKDNLDIQGHSRINLGYIEFEKGNYEKALAYYLEALRLFQDYDMNGTFEAYHALSQLSIAQGNIQLAKEHSDKASELLKDIDQPFEQSLYHELMGMIYTYENKWNEADNEFKEGLKASVRAIDRRLTPRIHFRSAQMHLKKGEQDKAHEHLENALSEFERMGMKLWVGKCEKALAGLE